jgi:hypothetical protein
VDGRNATGGPGLTFRLSPLFLAMGAVRIAEVSVRCDTKSSGSAIEVFAALGPVTALSDLDH